MARRLRNVRYEPHAQIVGEFPDPDADCFFGEVDLDDAVRHGGWINVEFVHRGLLYKGRAKAVAIDSEAGTAEVKGTRPTATEAG